MPRIRFWNLNRWSSPIGSACSVYDIYILLSFETFGGSTLSQILLCLVMTPPGVLLMPSRASVAHGKKVLQCHEESLITVSCGSSSIQRARGSCITVRILQAMLLSRPDWCRATRTQRVSKEFKSSAQLWTLVLYLSEKFPIAEIQALHKLGYIGQSLLNRSII